MTHRCAAAVLACFVLAGCGYNSKELYPEGYRTVSAPIFENLTFYRGVEFKLTEALVKEIEKRTPYKVVASGAADTRLTGTITSIEQSLLSRRRDGNVPDELELTLTVNFEWQDLRTGRPIIDRRGFSSVGRYIPARSVGEPVQIAQYQAVQSMARDIVSAMRSDWLTAPPPAEGQAEGQPASPAATPSGEAPGEAPEAAEE